MKGSSSYFTTSAIFVLNSNGNNDFDSLNNYTMVSADIKFLTNEYSYNLSTV